MTVGRRWRVDDEGHVELAVADEADRLDGFPLGDDLLDTGIGRSIPLAQIGEEAGGDRRMQADGEFPFDPDRECPAIWMA